VTVTAGSCVVDGSILANGGNGSGYNAESGGGSGGSIWLEVGSLTGTGKIESRGGDGLDFAGGGSGSGGGGRIAIYYDAMGFASERIQAYGASGGYNSGAGTIYLKDNAESYGDLIIDNANILTSLMTPHMTGYENFDSLVIRNKGRLWIDTALIHSGGSVLVMAGSLLAGASAMRMQGGTIELQSGTIDFDSVYIDDGLLTGPGAILSNIAAQGGEIRLKDSLAVSDTVLLNGGTMTGSGIIHGTVLNSASLDPGSSYGIVAIDGDYIQSAAGELSLDIGGLREGVAFDKLRVTGETVLDGVLNIAFDNGFVPSPGDRFNVIRFSSLAGSFSSINGLDSSLALARIDTCLVLIAGSDLASNSFADPVMVLSPTGNIPFSVHLRDGMGLPVVGADNVWLDFSGVSSLSPCGTEPLWPIVVPAMPSDTAGAVGFAVRAGGCTSDSVNVMTSHGVIGRVAIRSLDRSGGLLVTARDFVGDRCNDYNNDGAINAVDWTFFERYIGTSCLGDATDYTLLDVYTVPGPHDIFQGDTIQICGKLTNTVDESIQLDSVNFLSAGWGIARPWTTFAQAGNITLAGMDSIVMSQPFVVPESQHGCFKVRIYPRFATRRQVDQPPVNYADVSTRSLSGFSVEGATVSQIVQTLRKIYNLPINFIQAPRETPLYLGVFEGTVTGFLDAMTEQGTEYEYEFVDGRLFVYPSDPAYDVEITDVHITALPRLSAAGEYVKLMREHVSELAELVPPWVMGNPRASLYQELITLEGTDRMMDHLIQLLGDDVSLSVSIQPTASGRPGLTFHRQRPANKGPIGCSDCRPVGITEGNANFVPCGQDSCGSVLLADITGVKVQCCPGDPKCDCEGGMETEEVTTSGDCYTGAVETGEGCPIGAGGTIEDCMDEYALCIPQEAWPVDSCKQTLTQKIKICDKLIQTITISWTLRRSDGDCTTGTPSRSFGAPVPPSSCDSTPSKERQINRNAPKRQSPSVLASSVRSAAISHFDIPLGTEYGDSLYLYRISFLPNGWSFGVSDSGWVHVPDTIGVDITHPDEVADEDTGRVVFYAYNDQDVFAGNAEIMVYNPQPIVDVDEPGNPILPSSFALGQNYPNPFNPVTTIEYSLPSRAHVTIEVFNLLGQKVRTLVNDTKAAGSYRTEWTGTDDAGNTVPTGVYLYRLRADDFVRTKKMLLVK
jgi:FlgD Ig-like domain